VKTPEKWVKGEKITDGLSPDFSLFTLHWNEDGTISRKRPNWKRGLRLALIVS
jgi:hypothetical protein